MKIEVTEESLKINVAGKLVQFVRGDIVTVEDQIGRLACEYGWALDIDGQVETGARVPGANGEIVPDNITQPQQ